MDPGAQRRELAVEHVPAGVELRLRAVVVVGGVHRADHGDVVDAAADVRQPVADLDAALAVFLEADLERIELVPLLAVGIVDDRDPGQLELLGVLHVLERRLADGLAGVLGEHRLGVEGLQVADAAVHEQPDDALGLRREVRLAVGRRPFAVGAYPSRWSMAARASDENPSAELDRNARRYIAASMDRERECIYSARNSSSRPIAVPIWIYENVIVSERRLRGGRLYHASFSVEQNARVISPADSSS